MNQSSERCDEVFTAEHEMFRDTARRFIRKEIEPHYLQWETTEIGYPVELWKKAASAGLVGIAIPPEFGGAGADMLYEIILAEEMGRSVAGASTGATLFSVDLLTGMIVEFGTDEQKARYFPGILSGDVRMCAGITEPAGGSDVNAMQSIARRDGDDYLISGQKTFISNGMHANLCLYVARTDEDLAEGRGAMSMFLVDMDTPGFAVQRMNTMGEKAGSVAELFLDEVRVPASAMLGREGRALKENLAHLFMVDRVGIGLRALATAQLAFDLTVDYVKQRQAFGKRVFDFQNTQFKLAEMKADLVVGHSFRDTLLQRFKAGTLDNLYASVAKLWLCEKEFAIAHECLQLHGGYGYIMDSPIARIFTYARLETIYAGTSEIQKGMIARFL
jgi:acyl-CoA dehydrogenase